MKYVPLAILLLLLSCETEKEGKTASFPTLFEQSEGTQSATYEQAIQFYIDLAREFPEINIQTIGETDSGHPLHMVSYNPDGEFNFQKIRQNKLVLLINNGIHPGESDGIDATMLLYRDFALKKLPRPKNLVLVCIPVYNVGGALNRNSNTRVNQNGPESYGFRGNARNYDLNRDFIKNDTKNSRTFANIFHTVKPDIFIDTHVSNGADYQYTLSHLFTQQDKLGQPLGSYLHTDFLPRLTDSLAVKGWDITPYVNVHGRPPDLGFVQFMDTPRFSTGYTALWQSLGVMVETHMLKPYKDRVRATKDFLYAIVQLGDEGHERIRVLRSATRNTYREAAYYPISWVADTTSITPLEFKGFKADTLVSPVTGMSRLAYNRSMPYVKTIPYQDSFRASDSVEIPQAYLVKRSWVDIMGYMDRNGIVYSRIEQDSTYYVESYKISSYQTMDIPFEGHYPHYGTTVEKTRDSLIAEAGDFLIPTAQPGIRYLMETLEPQAVDSFFNWNIFDAILQPKEGFSSYVFEDIADSLLRADPKLQQLFAAKKGNEPQFAANAQMQLEWIYRSSPFYETAHMQYPVYRVLKNK